MIALIMLLAAVGARASDTIHAENTTIEEFPSMVSILFPAPKKHSFLDSRFCMFAKSEKWWYDNIFLYTFLARLLWNTVVYISAVE